jgi:hypothetical protein
MNIAVQKPRIVAENAASYRSRLLSIAAFAFCVIVFLALMTPHAAAQGCAMCYQNAASSGAQGRAALRHGILILLLPALSLFAGIFLLFYDRRNSQGD